jgi:type II secretory pathway pseudopilin PulG
MPNQSSVPPLSTLSIPFLRRTQRGFAELEYLIVVALVGIVTAVALYGLGPTLLANYVRQKSQILWWGP